MRRQDFFLLLLLFLLAGASFLSPDHLAALGARAMGRGALEAVTIDVLHELPWVMRGLAILGGIWILCRPELARPHPSSPSVIASRGLHRVAAVACMGTLLAIFVRFAILQSGLISGDEWNNEFTALLFTERRVWDTPPPHPEFFSFTYFVTLVDRTFSIFPPLWPLILAFGHLIGIGAAINAAVAGLAAYLVGIWHPNRMTGTLAAALLVLSPAFLFTAASSFAGPTVLALLMGQLLCLRNAASAGRSNNWWLFCGSLLWGLCFTAHYPTALGAGLPPLALVTWRRVRAQGLPMPLLPVVLGMLMPLLFLGAYHNGVHDGPPWLFPAALYNESMLTTSFTFSTIARGIAYTALHTVRLLGWTFPGLLLLAIACMTLRVDGDIRLLTVSMLGLVGLYVLYPSAGGPQFGPRYWFGLLGPLAICASIPVHALLSSYRGRLFLVALCIAGVSLLAVRTTLVARWAALENAPFRLADNARLQNAIVFMRNVNRADHARNAPGWNGSVLFVPDLGRSRDAELMAQYPDREVYTFMRLRSGPVIVKGRPSPDSH